MAAQLEEKKDRLISQVIDRLHHKLTERQLQWALPFVRHYYRGVGPDDLVDRNVLDLYGAALAHWNLARWRQPGKRLIRVYNPQFDEDGWQSSHTIIEIVHDDMPFLVDSSRMLINRYGFTVHLIVHPVMAVRRDREGNLLEVAESQDERPDMAREAMLHFEIDRQTDPRVLGGLERDLESVLDEVSASVNDWPAMSEKALEFAENLSAEKSGLRQSEVAEARAFLHWLAKDSFTFLGFREYSLEKENGELRLKVVPGTGLGILRNAEQEDSKSFSRLPVELRQQATEPRLLITTKSSSRATVHRPGYLDYVGVQRFDTSGNVVGESRFLGRYTSNADNCRPKNIPLVRNKVQRVMKHSGLRRNSHSAKALLSILETLPRDELFQSAEDELFRTATTILHLQERQRVKLIVRRDRYRRYLTCLVYLPRERFNTSVRLRIQELLRTTFGAHTVDFTVSLSESVLARIYLVAHTWPEPLPEYDEAELELRVQEIARTWEDELYVALLQEHGEEDGNRHFERYAPAFPLSYREDYVAPIAVRDIEKIEGLNRKPLGILLYRDLEAEPGVFRLKLFRRGEPISLSGILPLLENMGVTVLDERPYEIRSEDVSPTWIHDFGLVLGQHKTLGTAQLRELFHDAFSRVWFGKVEDDGFNRLVLHAQLDWKEVVTLRAYCKYLLQTPFPFSQNYMEQALLRHPQIATLLTDLFKSRFDPSERAANDERADQLSTAIERSLEQVENLDEDRILRRFHTLIEATLRTNFFQRKSRSDFPDFLAFKLDPQRIPGLPEPRPEFEMFVYSPRMEGIHLRGGKVARGGIRWSDRREDFRTEIFGLMKAQMVKNAVIVPVGAKGGFITKRLPDGDREAVRKEVLYCYKSYIRALLELTDNLEGGEVVPPSAVVRYDDDDPYLVVAADKGTATFSDTANEIAREYGFWMDDAFASGGSTGYDHKKLGITARGAWESVKRHFREVGRDIQSEPFTVVGIGSMNGDVFGNGMLLSRQISLVAAFSTREIFIDPDPDPERSYNERKRLFDLPGSSWSDYTPEALSKGGGIYSRHAKSITLSPEAKTALQVDKTTLPPNEVIKMILRAPVDLMWNGAVGTFVKASYEGDEQVGDRSADAIRVNADELRCRVVGEGGNLGLTYEARREYAVQGGRINTDFIDNSGGVDCSDHEVNIKILLNEVKKRGQLPEEKRRRLLADMADEVTRLVLRNNYQQSEALSMSEQQAPRLLDEHAGFIRTLEREGVLDRGTWHLPDEEEIESRRQNRLGLARPELAVLLAYSKISLYESLQKDDISKDAYLAEELGAYFPHPIGQRFGEDMSEHPLRPAIIANFIANSMVNRMGITFAHRLYEYTGATMPDIARAYTVTRRVFELPRHWEAIAALDNRIDWNLQSDLLGQLRRLVDRATLWFLHKREQPLDITDAVHRFAPGLAEFHHALPNILTDAMRERTIERAELYQREGVDRSLAETVAAVPFTFPGLDIVDISNTLDIPVTSTGPVYFQLSELLDFPWLYDRIGELRCEDRWDRLARSALRTELDRVQRALVQNALNLTPEFDEPLEVIERWSETNEITLKRYRQRLADYHSGTSGLAMINVALSDIRKLLSADLE